MNKKEVFFSEELKRKILFTSNLVFNVVKETLGPRGNLVIIKENNKTFVTKDGVTCLKSLKSKDNFENSIIDIIKQSGIQTEITCGDGTTSTVVLFHAIFLQAQKYLAASAAPVELKRGIDKAVKKVIQLISDHAHPLRSKEDIFHIATISANGDKTIGELIATAVDKIGKDGSITVEESKNSETSLNIIEGFRIDSGYLSKEFITDERLSLVKLSAPLVLITDERLEHVEQLLPVLQLVAREKRAFIIVADEVVDACLAACIYNSIKSREGVGGMKINIVKPPKYGQERRNIMKDLALSVGATFISKENGLRVEDATLEHLGTCKTMFSYKNASTFVGGKGDYNKIDERIESLKAELLQTDSMEECERIQERITRLSSGVAIIRVGGYTEVEVIEKKHRIEDALEAVKSAQQEGILPGGGIALLRISYELTDEDAENEYQKLGYAIIAQAIREPFRVILSNAGLKVDVIEEKLKDKAYSNNFDFGYDVSSDQILSLYDAGVIDPAKVTRCALQNAASVAGTLIMTNCAIIEI